MFSEYASRFLAQSQSRLSLGGQADVQDSTRHPLDRRRLGSSRPFAPHRLSHQSHTLAAGSPLARLPFASRFTSSSAAHHPPTAPLFYSATDDFRDEDDGEEHDREVADYYALQQSRRDFAASRLRDSSDLMDSYRADDPTRSRREMQYARSGRRTGGIRSSWMGDDATPHESSPGDTEQSTQLPLHADAAGEATEQPALQALQATRASLVDVELASTVHDSVDWIDGRDALVDNPPLISSSPAHYTPSRLTKPFAQRPRLEFIPQEPDQDEPGLDHEPPASPSPGTDSVPPSVALAAPPLRHDAFWANLYMLSLASMLASFLLVCLHTSTPSSSKPLGDTIYTTLHASFYLLAVDTLIAVVVALFWLALLRAFVRPLVLLILVAVPVILLSFSLYPFISSFRGAWHGESFQDRAMRWLSLIPAIVAGFWAYTVYRGRDALGRAIELLEFSCRILTANATLVLVGFATLASVVLWTWIWMLMFTRVFLGGAWSSRTHLFVVDTGTWWLAIFFVLVYLWSLAILAGLQRSTTAATVSQWYFHRFAIPAHPAARVVQAASVHASTTLLGTICLATLLSLAVRLPLLLLPKRLTAALAMCCYSLMPTSIVTLTNPLAITYAAIHSQPLAISARALSEMSFISRTSPTTTLTPHAAASTPGPTLLPYRLAKLLLHSTRLLTALAFGFGGWVSTARMLTLPATTDVAASAAASAASTLRGSAYAYIIGLIAGAIGWAVLGAMEGVLGGILDAVVVCWGSEVGAAASGGRRDGGYGQARYCREAGELLSE